MAFAIWLLAALFYLYEFFLGVFPGTIATTLIEDLALTPKQFAAMDSGYYIVYALMQIPAGLCIKRWRPKAALTFAALLSGGATWILSSSTSLAMATTCRCLMGFGASFGLISILTLSRSWFSKKRFPLMVGLVQMVGTAGPLLAGAPLLAWIDRIGSWRSALFVYALLGLGLGVLSFFFIEEKQRKEEESEGALPWKDRHFWRLCAISALCYAGAPLLGAFWGTTFLEALGTAPKTAAFLTSLIWVGMATGAPLLGALSPRTGPRPLFLTLAILGITASSALLSCRLTTAGPLAIALLSLGITASGQALAYATIPTFIAEKSLYVAFGTANTVVNLSASFIPWIATALFRNDLSAPSIGRGLLIIPACLLGAGLLSWQFSQVEVSEE